MTRRMLVWMAAAAAAWGADLPSADSLLERFLEATGGRKAHEARKSEIVRGTVEYASMGLKGKTVRWSAEGGLYRMTMELPQVGAMEAGVKDGVAWERSDLLGPRLKDGVERAEAIREAMNAQMRWNEFYEKAETTGEGTVDGEECYKVTLTPKEGAPETLFLSKKSGLAVKLTGAAVTQLGELPLEVLLRNYKDFGGILQPSQQITTTAGQQITFITEAVEANPAIPAGQFDFPPDVAALVARQRQAK